MDLISSFTKTLRYGGSILPRLGIYRTQESICNNAQPVLAAKGELMTFTAPECSFLEKCRRDFELPDYSRGYAIKDAWWMQLASVHYHGDCGALTDTNNHHVIAESIFDESSYKHTRVSNPVRILKTKQKKGIYTGIIRHPWSQKNFYHWMCDCLPRLFAINNYLETVRPAEPVTLLVHPGMKKFQKETLSLVLGQTGNIIIAEVPENEIWHVETFILPSWVSGTGSGAIPRACSEFLTSRLTARLPSSPHRAKRFYISREKAPNRKILNESELIPLMKKNDICILNMEDLGIEEQMHVFRDAELIIAGHGAGLSSLMVSRNATVLELFAQNNHRAFFFLLAKSRGLAYHYLDGSAMDADENYTLSSLDLEQALKTILG